MQSAIKLDANNSEKVGLNLVVEPESKEALLEEINAFGSLLNNEGTGGLSLKELSLEKIKNSILHKFASTISSNRVAIMTALRIVTENVIKTVTSLTNGTRSLDQVRKESSHLADYSSTIASAAEQLSATVNSIGQNLQNTIKASSQAKDFAGQGTAVIDQTVARIQNVNDILAGTNTALQSLLKTAERADKIIKVVNDISSKTDLLALNASIEAARAGAAGKGFAVVAHEVGRLSEKTQASISDIEEIISSITESVNEVSARLINGLDSAKNSVQEAANAKTTFSNIVERISYVDNEVSNISEAVKEQGQAVVEIAKNVGTISKSSKSINDQIGKVGDLVDAVTRTSNSTRIELGKFDLGSKTILEHAKIDHMLWMHRLRRMIDGKEVITNDEFTDHTACRLGKWYYNAKIDGYSEPFKVFYRELEGSHVSLHRIAANLIRVYNSGNSQECIKLYEQLIPISQDMVDKLDQMV